MVSSSSAKKRKSSFIACPACGKSVPETSINEHLDKQCKSQQSPPTLSPPSKKVPKINGDNGPSKPTLPNNGETKNKDNAFSHMMLQSRRLFSSSGDGAPSQRFHLSDDGTASWVDIETTDEASNVDIQWSADVQLKQNKVRLQLSTSIPPSKMPVALVRKHSRLSVPVLKSILQKSVRRRRALPACRVAMEIMDKAMGALLRRLPIIILEDSTLHPDFGLLCWLMAAETKGYQLPTEMIEKILCIIYEVSSCPWTDYVPSNKSDDDYVQTNFAELPDDSKVLLKSISMRKSYGGMACDMAMMKSYEQVWKKRFQDGSIDQDLQSRLSLNLKTRWSDIPTQIHDKPRQQSAKFVIPLVQQRLDRLEFKDICIEGVDFHCSNILDQVMSDKALSCKCSQRLKDEGLVWDGNEEQLMKTLKQCMWKFSSGVNHRQPLLGEKLKGDDNHALKAFWMELMSKRAKELMAHFVKIRLAS